MVPLINVMIKQAWALRWHNSMSLRGLSALFSSDSLPREFNPLQDANVQVYSCTRKSIQWSCPGCILSDILQSCKTSAALGCNIAALLPCPFFQREGEISLSGCWTVLTAVLDGAEHCQWQCEQSDGCRSPPLQSWAGVAGKGERWVSTGGEKCPTGQLFG